MGYLFGDSTASDLEVNYIELLRDAIDFAVEVLVAGQRVRKWNQSSRDRALAADHDLRRLDDLEHRLRELLGSTDTGRSGSPAERCAARIGKAASDAVRAEKSAIKSGLADDLARMSKEIGRERAGLHGMLERLLLRHDVPGARRRFQVSMMGTNAYAVQLTEQALGIEAVIDLEIPSDNLYGQAIRVEKVMDLEIRVPDMRGWLHKTVKLVPQRLGKKYVVEVDYDGVDTVIKLRTSPERGDDSGFDLTVSGGDEPGVGVTLTRVPREEGDEGFEPETDDAAKLTDLAEALVAPLAELVDRRQALASAELDGKALAQHENPVVLVDRLIEAMAPVVTQISEHSLSRDELVIKRLLADDRREEIFVSKAELEQKLRRLPPALRRRFIPLGLGTGTPITPETRDEEEVTGVAERDAAQVSGDIEVSPGDRPDDETSVVMQIEDSWLEEVSDMTAIPVATPDDESLSGALRSLEADGGDDKPPA